MVTVVYEVQEITSDPVGSQMVTVVYEVQEITSDPVGGQIINEKNRPSYEKYFSASEAMYEVGNIPNKKYIELNVLIEN